MKSERHNAFDLEELKVQIMNIVSCQIRWNGSSDERREQLNIWANEARTLINKHLEEVFYNDDLRTVIGSVLSVGSELSVEETSALLCVIEYYQSQLDYPEEKRDLSFQSLVNVYWNSCKSNVVYFIDGYAISGQDLADNYLYPYTVQRQFDMYYCWENNRYVINAYAVNSQEELQIAPDSIN